MHVVVDLLASANTFMRRAEVRQKKHVGFMDYSIKGSSSISRRKQLELNVLNKKSENKKNKNRIFTIDLQSHPIAH